MQRHRCGLLAAWASAWLGGRVPYDEVIEAVVGSDHHEVRGLPETRGPVPLGWLLTAARERGERRLSVVLPAPGDPRGLPGPGPFTTAALSSGAAVRGGTLGVVPDSADSRVEWTSYLLTPGGPVTTPVGVAEADETLRTAVREAARELAALDVARWRPEVAGLARGDRAPRLRLPPGHSGRALGLLERAHRLAEVLELAFADTPGGALTGHEAGARDAALRPLATAVRQAMTAAYNA